MPRRRPCDINPARADRRFSSQGDNFPPAGAGPMAIGLVGFMRVRRHPHHRARSAPPCGVSRGPRAYRVRVPVVAIVQAASGGSVDVISVIVWNSVRNSGRCCTR